MIWIVLKWIGIVLGGALLLLLALVGAQYLRDAIRYYRKHRCPACGGRKFQMLTGAQFRTYEGADLLLTLDLCLQCQNVWSNDSRERILLPCTEEQAQKAKDEYAKREQERQTER